MPGSAGCRRRRHRVRLPRPRARAARGGLRRRRAGRARRGRGRRGAPSGSGVATLVHRRSPTRSRCRASTRSRSRLRRRRTPRSRSRRRVPASTCSARSRSHSMPREAAAMLDAAEQAGVGHLVGHEFRWAPERAVVGRAIADGRIGEPRLVSLVSIVPLVADPDDPRSRVVVRRRAGRRLARRVGLARRRPGAHLARRVRVGERDAARSCRRAPVSPTTRSPFASGCDPVSKA